MKDENKTEQDEKQIAGQKKRKREKKTGTKIKGKRKTK